MGLALAHEDEAPFPEAPAEFFVRSLCPRKEKSLNPSKDRGRPRTPHPRQDRWGITPDKRPCQAEIARRRLAQGVLSFD
jgi:hypothetical protein